MKRLDSFILVLMSLLLIVTFNKFSQVKANQATIQANQAKIQKILDERTIKFINIEKQLKEIHDELKTNKVVTVS